MSNQDDGESGPSRDAEGNEAQPAEDRVAKSAKDKAPCREAARQHKRQPGENGSALGPGLPRIGKLTLPKGAGVGYGQPPKEHRFQPGQSGNPRGRPIGARTRKLGLDGHRLFDGVRAELERAVRYREGGEEREMPAIQAVMRQHINKAMQGVIGSARLIVDAASQVDNYERRQHERLVEALIEYMQSWEPRLRPLERNPDPAKAAEIPLPHPDQIDIDFMSGEISLNGPASEAERDALEQLWEWREQLREYVKIVDHMLESTESEDQRKALADMRGRLLEQLRLSTEELGDGDEGKPD